MRGLRKLAIAPAKAALYSLTEGEADQSRYVDAKALFKRSMAIRAEGRV
jgi:hypothetical protein